MAKNFLRGIIKAVIPYGLYQLKKQCVIANPLYIGNRVYCPCCQKKAGKFKDSKYNDGRKEKGSYKNTICPYCGSTPRDRIVCCWLGKNSELFKDKNVLMFAAEPSVKLWFDKNGFHYTTADLFDKNANIICDIQKTPFLDATWPLITCNHVLQQVEDYHAALFELYRILKNDGILEITVPVDKNIETTLEEKDICSDSKDRKKIFYGESNSIRLFGSDFLAILKECGFLVDIIEGDKLPENIRAVIGPSMLDDNRMYICRKTPK